MRTITSPPWASPATASIEERHEHLMTVSHAMWRLLKTRLDLTDEQLHLEVERSQFQSADLPKLIDCVTCYRPMQSASKCCLYCGTETALTIERWSMTRERGAVA